MRKLPCLLTVIIIWFGSCLEFAYCRIRPSYCQELNSHSEPSQFFWKISREPPAYFFGTIHMPYVEVWDFLSPELKSAFYHSQNIIMELDLSDFYTLKQLHHCRMLPEGAELKNVLPSDIYARLKNHIDYVKERMPSWLGSDDPSHSRAHANYVFERIAGNWERRRPIWVMLMLNSLTEESTLQFGAATLDSYLIQEAKRRSQDVGAIEYVAEHCHALNSLSASQAIFALDLTLTMHEQLRMGRGRDDELSARTELIRHYNCGTLDETVFDNKILNVLETSAAGRAAKSRARQIDSYFKKELVYKRNLRMAERVVKVLRSQPEKSFFFAFGTGHFLGDNSVIDLVRQSGLVVEPVYGHYDLKKHRKKGRKSRFRPASAIAGSNGQNWQWSAARRHRGGSIETTAEPRKRVFNPLWVPIKNYSPRPWQEINFEPFTPRSASIIVNLNRHDPGIYHENSTGRKTILSLLTSVIVAVIIGRLL